MLSQKKIKVQLIVIHAFGTSYFPVIFYFYQNSFTFLTLNYDIERNMFV